ncbi:hypothetical protein MMC10_010596 [Thelotrema lepadinum]|nr:hypothetical protein [Thelotrema lepadinum]
MTFTIIVFLYRKPGTTMEQYMDHYNTTHMDVIRELTGPENFPLSHTRHFIHRTSVEDNAGGPSNLKTPATLFTGQQTAVDFDCVTVMTFQDENAFQGFHKAISSPEGKARLDGDEMVFQDPTKTTAALAAGVYVATKD